MVLKQINLEICVSEEVLQMVDYQANRVKASLGNPESRASFEAYLNVDSRVQKLRRISDITGVELKTSKMLEIGSGLGMFLCVCRKLGIDCWGLEPSFGSYSGQLTRATNLLSCNDIPLSRIINSSAEKIPLNDNEFDLVVSFDVLEHVTNPADVLEESLRVLKPGGYLYFLIPNYLWFWEWHYGIPWLPCMPKWFAKYWVLINHRNPQFLKELTFITPWKLRRWLRAINQAHVLQISKSNHSQLSTDVSHLNDWLKNVKVKEVIELTGAMRTGGRFGRLFMRTVRHVSSYRVVQNYMEKLGMMSIIELVVRKSI